MHMVVSSSDRLTRNRWLVGSLVFAFSMIAISIGSWSGEPQADGGSSIGDVPEKVYTAASTKRSLTRRVEYEDARLGESSYRKVQTGRDIEAKSDGTTSRGFQVTIRRPSGPPLIELKQPDPLGRVGRVTCSTCHSVRAPNLENRTPSDLKEFHQNMSFAHDKLACYACHNPRDSDTLRLADGSALAYSDVMNLCAQCHGPQAENYSRGAHGGMNGYWDLNRGGRVRNNCIDCHDPHVPAFPTMQPTFAPRDRFLVPSPHRGQASHKETDDGDAGRE